MSVYRVRSSNLAQFLSTFQGRTGRNSNDAERAKFEQSQASSVHKILTTTECEPKEKHIRNLILGTFHEQGSYLFWTLMINVQLESNPIVCWKFCYLFHRILRDGHKNVITDSFPVISYLNQLGQFWSSLPQNYGAMIYRYCQLIGTKLNFHRQHTFFPGNLQISFSNFKATTAASTDAYFDISASLLDYLDSILDFQSLVFKAIDQYYANSMTVVGQCRLRPLVPCIHEANTLYDLIVKTLFEMHNVLQASDLEGHRVRFNKCFNRLKDFYRRSRSMQFFHNLIVIPDMPGSAPNFHMIEDLESYRAPICTITSHDTGGTPSSRRSTPRPSVQSLTEPELILDLSDEDDAARITGSQSESYMNNYVTMEPRYSEIHLPSPPSIDVSTQNPFIEPIYATPGRLIPLAPPPPPPSTTTVSGTSSVQSVVQQLNNLKLEMSAKDQHISDLEKKLTLVEQKSVEDIDAKISEWNSILSEKDEKYSKIKQLYGKLREQHIALLRSESQLKKELRGANDKMSKMMEINVACEDSISEHTATSIKANEDLVKRVEEQLREIDVLKSTLVQNNSDLEKIGFSNEILNNRVLELIEECEKLSEQVESLRVAHQENVSLNEQKDNRILSLENANNELSKRLTEVIEQNASLKALSADNESLRKELEETKKLYYERDLELQRLRKVFVESNEKAKREFEAQTAQMSARMEELENALQEANQMVDQVHKNCEENARTLHRSESEKERLQQELKNKQHIFEDVKSGKKELEEDLIDLLNEKEKIEERAMKMQSRIVEQEALLHSLADSTVKAEERAKELTEQRIREISEMMLTTTDELFRAPESSALREVLASIVHLLDSSNDGSKCKSAISLTWNLRQLQCQYSQARNPLFALKLSEILLCTKYDDKAKMERFCLQLCQLLGRCFTSIAEGEQGSLDKLREVSATQDKTAFHSTVLSFIEVICRLKNDAKLNGLAHYALEVDVSGVIEASLALYSETDSEDLDECALKLIRKCVQN